MSSMLPRRFSSCSDDGSSSVSLSGRSANAISRARRRRALGTNTFSAAEGLRRSRDDTWPPVVTGSPKPSAPKPPVEPRPPADAGGPSLPAP